MVSFVVPALAGFRPIGAYCCEKGRLREEESKFAFSTLEGENGFSLNYRRPLALRFKKRSNRLTGFPGLGSSFETQATGAGNCPPSFGWFLGGSRGRGRNHPARAVSKL